MRRVGHLRWDLLVGSQGPGGPDSRHVTKNERLSLRTRSSIHGLRRTPTSTRLLAAAGSWKRPAALENLFVETRPFLSFACRRDQ